MTQKENKSNEKEEQLMAVQLKKARKTSVGLQKNEQKHDEIWEQNCREEQKMTL